MILQRYASEAIWSWPISRKVDAPKYERLELTEPLWKGQMAGSLQLCHRAAPSGPDARTWPLEPSFAYLYADGCVQDFYPYLWVFLGINPFSQPRMEQHHALQPPAARGCL